MDFAEYRDEEEDEVLEQRPGCMRGVLKLVLFLLVALVLTVALIPTLLSSDSARQWALDKANASLAPAQVSCERWSLGWFSPVTLDRLAYLDPAHGADVKVEQISFDRGLLRLLPIGVLNLGNVTVKKPEIAVSPAPKEEAAEAEKAAPAKKGGFIPPVADAAGSVTVQDGRVQVTGAAPEVFVAQHVEGTVDLASFRKPIGVQAKMQVGGGTLALEGHVQSLKDLAQGTELEQPEQLTLKLVSVDLTAFGPLIQQATGEPWISSGVAEGALTASIMGVDQFSAEGGVLVNGLSVTGAGQPRSPKGDVALMVNVGYNKKDIQITKFEFSSPWLRTEASGSLKAGAQGGAMTGSIQAKASAHLAPLTRDFASVLGLSKAFKLQKGELNAEFTLDAGDGALGVDAKVSTADLAMTVDDEPLVLRPEPSLVFKAKFPVGELPEVETLHLKLPFADVYGSGKFDAAVVKGKLDLTVFSRDFKRMFKDAPPMVGSAYLDVATKGDEGGVAITSFLKLSDVAAELKRGQRMVVSQGTLKLAARLPVKNGRPEKELQNATFDFTLENGKVSGGWKRLVPPTGGQALVLRGFTLSGDFELGSVRRLLGGFIPTPAQGRMNAWQGHVVANATAEAAVGVVKARMNAAGQQIVAPAESNAVWRVPDIRMEGAVTQGGPKEGTRVEVTLSGCGALERDGQTLFAEKAAKVAADVLLAADGKSVQISKLSVMSGLGELETEAEVSELSTRCVVSAKGKAAIDFEAVTQLLQAKGLDGFELTGRQARAFRFTAPVAGGAATVLSEGEFTGAAYLASFKGLGLTAGASDATFKLSKGLLKVSYEPVLNDGKLRLVPELDASGRVYALGFPADTHLLENVTLTQGMMDTLLVNMNPLFQGSTVLGGTVSLDLRSCRVAAEQTPAKSVAVDMDVLLKGLKMEMGPSLCELLAMIKVSDRSYSVDKLPVHIVVKDGKVVVDPVKMVIDRQPVIFSGWVGFDGTVKYLVEVPVTERLAGNGTAGKVLKGTVIKIPVSGNVKHPKLDSSAVQNTLGGLLKGAVGEHAVEKVGSFLDKLQKELKK